MLLSVFVVNVLVSQSHLKWQTTTQLAKEVRDVI